MGLRIIRSRSIVLGILVFLTVVSPSRSEAKEIRLDCNGKSVFATWVQMIRASSEFPRQFKDKIELFCKEQRFSYNSRQAPSSRYYSGWASRDRIVLGEDRLVKPTGMMLGDEAFCAEVWHSNDFFMGVQQIGDDIIHEFIHVTTGSDSVQGESEENWTQAWAGCLAGRVYFDFLEHSNARESCRGYIFKRDYGCQTADLETPRNFHPPVWWEKFYN